MSNLLIGIDKDGNLENNGWRELKEFSGLVSRFGDDGMKVVIMTWDSYSVMMRIQDDEDREERVSKQYMKMGWKEFVKSKDYIEAKYLYKSLNYDPELETKKVYTGKLEMLNKQINQLDIISDSAKFNEYVGIQKKVFEQLDNINVKLVNRIIQKRDLSDMILSGIEVFYKRAEKDKREDDLFRNKSTLKRKDAKTLAREKVEKELEAAARASSRKPKIKK